MALDAQTFPGDSGAEGLTEGDPQLSSRSTASRSYLSNAKLPLLWDDVHGILSPQDATLRCPDLTDAVIGRCARRPYLQGVRQSDVHCFQGRSR